MTFTTQHKALSITALLSATLVMLCFSVHISQYDKATAETFYDINTEPLSEEAETEIFEAEDITKTTETNTAYNTETKYKRFAQAYQLIEPPKEYTPSKTTHTTPTEINNTTETKVLSDAVLQSYDTANAILKQHSAASNGDANTTVTALQNAANTNSSTYYSLVNRTHNHLPTPIYLCEQGGKIVINISVNQEGKVTKAYVNKAYKNVSLCLQEHALEYALQAQFNTSEKLAQLGSITFYFKGKA